jgi:hypothetical protein
MNLYDKNDFDAFVSQLATQYNHEETYTVGDRLRIYDKEETYRLGDRLRITVVYPEIDTLNYSVTILAGCENSILLIQANQLLLTSAGLMPSVKDLGAITKSEIINCFQGASNISIERIED